MNTRKQELLRKIDRLTLSLADTLTQEEREYIRVRDTMKGRKPKRYLELLKKDEKKIFTRFVLSEAQAEYSRINNYTVELVAGLVFTVNRLMEAPIPLGQATAFTATGETSMVDFNQLMSLLLQYRGLIEEATRGRISIYDYWISKSNTVINKNRLDYFRSFLNDDDLDAYTYDGIVTGSREQSEGLLVGGTDSDLSRTFSIKVVMHKRSKPGGRFSRYFCCDDKINLSRFQIYPMYTPRGKDLHCLQHSLMCAGLASYSVPTEYFTEDGSISTEMIGKICSSLNIGICVHTVTHKKYYPQHTNTNNQKIKGLVYYHICKYEDHYMPWYTSATEEGRHYLGSYNTTVDMITSLIKSDILQLLPDKYLEQIGKSQYISGNSLDLNSVGDVKPYSNTNNEIYFLPRIRYNYEISDIKGKLTLLNKYVAKPTQTTAQEYIDSVENPSDAENILIEQLKVNPHSGPDTLRVEQEYNTIVYSCVESVEISMLKNDEVLDTTVVNDVEGMFNWILCKIPRNKADFNAQERIDLKAEIKSEVTKYLEDHMAGYSDVDSRYKHCYTYFRYSEVNDGYVETITPDVHKDLSDLKITISRNSKMMIRRIISSMVNDIFQKLNEKGNNSKHSFDVCEIMGEDKYRSPISKTHIPIILSNISHEYVSIVTFCKTCSFSGTISNPRGIKCTYKDISLAFKQMPNDLVMESHEDTVNNFISYYKDLYTITGMGIVDHTSLASLGHDYLLKMGCYNDTKELFSTLRDFIQGSISTNIVGTHNGDIVESDIISFDFNNAFAASLVELSENKYLPSGKPTLIPQGTTISRLIGLNHPFWVEINLSNIKIKEMPFPVVKGDQLTKDIRVSSVSLRDLIEYHDLTQDDINGIQFIRGIIFKDHPTDNCDQVIRYLHECRNREKENGNESLSKLYKQLLVTSAYGVNGTKPTSTRTYIKQYESIPEDALPSTTTLQYRVLPGNKVLITKECHRLHGNVVHRQKLILDNHNYRMRVCIKQVLKAGEQVYYVGVDSLHCSPGSAKVLSPVIGNDLGQLKVEYQGRGIYVRAGTWTIQCEDGSEVYRTSGFPKAQVEENVQKHGSAKDLFKYHINGGETEYQIGQLTRTLKFKRPEEPIKTGGTDLGYLFSIACC